MNTQGLQTSYVSSAPWAGCFLIWVTTFQVQETIRGMDAEGNRRARNPRTGIAIGPFQTQSKKVPSQQEFHDFFHRGPAFLFASINLLSIIRNKKPNSKWLKQQVKLFVSQNWKSSCKLGFKLCDPVNQLGHLWSGFFPLHSAQRSASSSGWFLFE